MKYFNRFLVVVALTGISFSCDLEKQDDPNNITPEGASLDDLYNSIQIGFANLYQSAQMGPGRAARMYQAQGSQYDAFTTSTSFNGLWDDVYADLFPDIDALIGLSDAAVASGGASFDIHVGSAKIMKGYALMILVDMFGDVPYSEAGQGVDIISPKLDDGSDVYDAAIGLLDDGIAQLTGTIAAPPAFDNFYAGNAVSWITVAKTLKMRAALNMADGGTFFQLASDGDFINTSAGDFQLNYGSNRTLPDSRHPLYRNHYEQGDGNYLSNYYMWLLVAEKQDAGGDAITDPRIRYYFYRKVSDAENQAQNTYSCHFTTFPTESAGSKLNHWDDIDPRLRETYCVLIDGYGGRDHLNGDGIPPDGPTRTSYGLYPMGGQYDDEEFTDTHGSGVIGGLGEGIAPLMLSSFVDFMRAEAELSLAGGTPANAKALLIAGIEKSMAKVSAFEALVPTTLSAGDSVSFGPTNKRYFTKLEQFGMNLIPLQITAEDSTETRTRVEIYVDAVDSLYDATTTNAAKLDMIVKEHYIAAWGNGLEAYNLYKRTGYPGNMQPGLEANVGAFPNSFFLPADMVDRNGNVSQKDGLGIKVFWQSASVNPY